MLKYAVVMKKSVRPLVMKYMLIKGDLHCCPAVSFINMLILFYTKLICIKMRKRKYFFPLKISLERDSCLHYTDIWSNGHDVYSASVSITEIALYGNCFVFIPVELDVKSITLGVYILKMLLACICFSAVWTLKICSCKGMYVTLTSLSTGLCLWWTFFCRTYKN